MTVTGLDKEMVQNELRFNDLPTNYQMTILRYLDDINDKLKQSFGKKLVRSVHILAFEISPIEQMWIVISLLVPLLFLMNAVQARQMAYLLPLIAICYALDNNWNGYREINQEATLFPTEESIKTRYLKKPLSSTISLQQTELKLGWHDYLIDQWANETPATDPLERQQQIEKGQYRFQVARVLAQASQPPHLEMYAFRRKQSLAVLLIYVFWNIFFSWFVNKPRNTKRESSQPTYS